MNELRNFLKGLIVKNISTEAWKWLEEQAALSLAPDGIVKLNTSFVVMPRKTGKAVIKISTEEEKEINALRAGFSISGWTVDRLCRVWLLMHLDAGNKEKYTGSLENLFLNAEMSELVALYSSLPVLAYPESWKRRCAEGIRSNIGQVLDAIICNNPFPAEQLEEAAWNQLVLKAIFNEKPILQISGFRPRRNQKLADALSDYAHERWAAHRSVNPLLWIFLSPYIHEKNFSDIQRIFSSGDMRERHAAALVCYESNYAAAKKLLDENKELKSNIEQGLLTWESVANGMSDQH